MEEIYQRFLLENKQGNIANAVKELTDTSPAPMNTMLEKQPRADALKKRAERQLMTVKDVPPTAPGRYIRQ